MQIIGLKIDLKYVQTIGPIVIIMWLVAQSKAPAKYFILRIA